MNAKATYKGAEEVRRANNKNNGSNNSSNSYSKEKKIAPNSTPTRSNAI